MAALPVRPYQQIVPRRADSEIGARIQKIILAKRHGLRFESGGAEDRRFPNQLTAHPGVGAAYRRFFDRRVPRA